MRNSLKALAFTACLLAAASPALAFNGKGKVSNGFLYLTDEGMTLKLEPQTMVCGHADLAPLARVINSARKHVVAWGTTGIQGNCATICVSTLKETQCATLYNYGWQ
jgi:hypothetical protein